MLTFHFSPVMITTCAIGEVPISLPEPLRAKLEDDCYFIRSQKSG